MERQKGMVASGETLFGGTCKGHAKIFGGDFKSRAKLKHFACKK